MNYAKLWWTNYILGFNGGGGGGAAGSQLIFTSDDIDATTLGAQDLFTVTSSRYAFFIPTDLVIYASLITAFSSTVALNAGSNSTAFDNLLSGSMSLSPLTATGKDANIPLSSNARIPAGLIGTSMKAKINTAAVADAFTIRVMLKGIGVN